MLTRAVISAIWGVPRACQMSNSDIPILLINACRRVYAILGRKSRDLQKYQCSPRTEKRRIGVYCTPDIFILKL
jgi:hypothetical protein